MNVYNRITLLYVFNIRQHPLPLHPKRPFRVRPQPRNRPVPNVPRVAVPLALLVLGHNARLIFGLGVRAERLWGERLHVRQ